ncbi:MAG TPA: hypothetical protein VGB61_15815 [Pyrinomonadaceae bacterium]
MSRLNFAPKQSDIKITDIKRGLGVFTPKPDQFVSFAALKAALKKTGYALDRAEITVAGKLARDGGGVGGGWVLVAEPSGQRFILEGARLEQLLAEVAPEMHVELTGDWKTAGAGTAAREVVIPREIGKAESERAATRNARFIQTSGARAVQERGARVVQERGAGFAKARYEAREASGFSDAPALAEATSPAVPLAPIRVTSPGLTVYQGGAVVPRLFLIKQHLGDLEVNRQVLDLSISYTPTATLQLEAEVPFSRTSYDDGGANFGSGVGLGNVTLWAKYRFFRRVKTYGDRQAAARFGLELPTGSKSAPDEREVNAPAFVRQQLTPIAGGLSPHFDLAFSQAGGRFIFGGNVEGIVRSERDGFRLGHEVRVNTDLEYVLLPFKYDAPGRELFLILETTFVHRGLGRLDSAPVPGSNSTEYYLAPGLQYAAAPRFLIEGGFQFPVVRNTGPSMLRNDRNILFGIRYLF